MPLFQNLFNRKKTLSSDEVGLLLQTLTTDREPVIIQTASFKFVSEILDFDRGVFQVRNNLSRDEVLYQLRGHSLSVSFPYELTLYKGATALAGLGMMRQFHTLKFRVPEEVEQDEHRTAYRVSHFQDKPTVTFTTNSFDIIRAQLVDISMTGCGIRVDPRWSLEGTKLKGAQLIIDIKLSDKLRVSSTGDVRYMHNHKIGVQFHDLAKETKQALHKFIVEARREEQRSLIEARRNIQVFSGQTDEGQPEQKPVEKIENPKGKPTALIVSDNDEASDFLNGILNRKFYVLNCSSSVTDIRTHLNLSPSLVIMELSNENPDTISQLKKVATLVPGWCVLMFFGSNLRSDTIERFDHYSDIGDRFIDLHNAKKILTFKKIDTFYEAKSP